MIAQTPRTTLFPYTTLFRSWIEEVHPRSMHVGSACGAKIHVHFVGMIHFRGVNTRGRSEEHTSELQSHSDLVCRLLLEKKKNSLCLITSQLDKHVSIITRRI